MRFVVGVKGDVDGVGSHVGVNDSTANQRLT
jgi:hypothetical protein